MTWVDQLTSQVMTGSLLVSLPIAALAGVVSFASPCVLPLVPGYLGYVTGLFGAEQRRSRLLAGAALFVLGFTVIYMLVGTVLGTIGAALIQHRDLLTRIAGVVVVSMGLIFLGVIPGKDVDARVRWRPAAGLAGAPLLGAVFGLGWAPCFGPVLTAIAALSLSQGGAVRGAVLTLAYCLGLGVPFLLVALGLGSDRLLARMRRHRTALTRFGGGLLLVVGVLLVSGLWNQWIDALRVPISGVRTWL